MITKTMLQKEDENDKNNADYDIYNDAEKK